MKQPYFNLIAVCLLKSKVIATSTILALLLFADNITAQTAGPNNPTTQSMIGTGGSWTTPGNIYAPDGQNAYINISSAAVSRSLRAGGFGFSIPSTAVITGIELRILRMGTVSSSSIIDSSVRIVKAGNAVGTNMANPTPWTSSFQTITYGSPTDLWGTTWTASEVNAANFGAEIAVTATGNARTAYIDHISMTVYFIPPPVITSFAATSACQGSATMVTINGTHLQNATSVLFNGVPAAISSNSNTQITAVLPATATTGNISVTTASGTATSAGVFTVHALPVIDPVTGSNAVCVGSTTTLASTTPGGTWSSSATAVASINSSGVITAIAPGNAVITYSITNVNNCTSQVTFPITVNAVPVVSAPSTVCVGQTAQLSPSAGGTWTSGNPSVAMVDNNGVVTGIAPGSASFTFTHSATNCSATTTAMQVHALPVIIQQPVSQTICSGENTVFSITATGSSLTYQWFRNATPLVNGPGISGANTATLNLSNVQVSQASADYHCVVGSICTGTITSASATLSVMEKVVISAQPQASISGCENSSLQIAVSATGAGLNYQWYKDASMLLDNSDISGSGTNTLTLSNLSAASAGNYYVVITGTAPCPPVTSANSVLTITTAPAITQQPASATVCSGTTTSLQVTATGSGLNYQWFRQGNPISNGGNISGATTSTLTINPVTVGDSAADYYVVISSSCQPDAVSNMVELSVVEAVVIATQPSATTVCTGETAAFSVSATGEGLTYQWYKGVSPLTDGGSISGATSSTLMINPVSLTDAAANYRVVVTGTAPCAAVTSANAALVVNQSPALTSQPASLNRCSGQSATFTVTATGGSLTYQWYFNGNPLSNGGNISGATSASLVINPVAMTDSGNYHVVVGNPCLNDATSNTATLTVNQRPVIPAQAITVCSGQPFSITPVNGFPDAATIVPANTVYSWSAQTGAGITGGQAQSHQASIFGTLVNTTTIVRTATFSVTPLNTDGSCSGTAFTVTVTVNPVPVVLDQSRSVCNGQAFTITPANGSGNSIPAGTTYSWGAPVVTGGITGGTSGTGLASIGQTLTNPTASVQTATYTVTPSTPSCTGNPFTITVSVNPSPTAAVAVASQTICSGTAITPFMVTNSNNIPCGVVYNWVRDNTTSVTGTASGSATIAMGGTYSFAPILTNTTTVAQNVTFTITPSNNGIPGTPVTATVTVLAPSAGGSATISTPGASPLVTVTTVCHYASGTIYLQNQTGSVLRWESSTNGGVTWTQIAETGNSHNYVNLTVTTIFRAVVQNETCSTAYSGVAVVNVVPNVKPTPVTATPQTICVGESSILNSQSGYATSSQLATGGAFQTSNPQGWLVDGCGNCLNAGASNTSPGPFQLSATNGGTYSGITYTATGKFAIANGAFDSVMETPVFNTFGLATASLQFNHAFNLLAGAWVRVELSLDGGATWGVTLQQWNGPAVRAPYNNFPLSNISLNNYIGQANLKVRFVYHGVGASSWAIDNIRIPEMPNNLTTQWIDVATDSVISTSSTLTVSPTETTTYAIVSSLNGCTSFGPEGTTYITVYVNPRPTSVIGSNQTICMGGTATFSVTLTGVAPWSLTYSNGTTSTTVNNITSNPYTFTVPNVTANQTYTITSLSDSRCVAQPQHMTGSATVTVLNGQQGLWTGLVSTDWFDCMNWAGGLPTSTVDAVIPAGMPRMPVIDPSNSAFAGAYAHTATARDIIVAAGASLTMPAVNSVLQVSRDWLNGGTFNAGLGTVVFNGGALNQVQNINIGIKNNEQFYNMIVNTGASAKGVSVIDGFELTVANHLTLTSGDLRLTGEAQLVQMGTTANPVAGTGKLLRDQQGTQSSFNYNYWSSPVSADNLNYTVGSVLRDGTNSAALPFNPGSINFGNGVYFADGVLASPIKISNSWINKFTAVSNDYYSWQFIGSTGTVKVGEGFTMKGTTGTAAVTDLQNYTFIGKPNNGNITLSISPGQSYLIGNPYPSALDADQFIRDNIKDGGNAATNVFTGALYFWDHFGGQTHLVAGYVGGYATYTLMGGVVAIANSPLNINDGSMGSKVPTRYVAVGQAFFIGTIADPSLTTNNPSLTTPITGGPVSFKNSQRAFRTEAAGSVFFRAQNDYVSVPTVDARPRIRLNYSGPGGLHRQILTGADEFASANFDLGYDAPMIDISADDMYFEVGSGKLAIQAISAFEPGTIIPMGIKVTNQGISKISLGQLENADDLNIYIHDNLTGTYHNLLNGEMEIELAPGQYNGRFSLRFSENSLGIHHPTVNATATAVYHADQRNLKIRTGAQILKVDMFDMTGRFVNELIGSSNSGDWTAQVPPMAAGAYIVRIQTDLGSVSQKISVK